MQPLPFTKTCFACGDGNPIGLKLKFHTDGKRVQTHINLSEQYTGFARTVHGGIIATILDEVMVWACAVQTRRFTYCAELTIRYHAPTPPNQGLLAIGEMTLNRKDRIFETKGELLDPQGVKLASSSGKYIPILDKDASGLGVDLIGDDSYFAGLRSAK